MKIILTESQFTKLNRSTQTISSAIVKYMDEYISKGKRKITSKTRNYGNLREDWCVDEKETITAVYFFDEGKFRNGHLFISKSIVESLATLLSIRKTYVLHVILEWYDETMVPKFENIVEEYGLQIDEIDTSEKTHVCIPESEKPEGITDEEMIDYIVDHTLYTKLEVLHKIKSGEENLDDLFLQIMGIQNRKKITGF